MPRKSRGQSEAGPDAVDQHVGARIRLRRALLGMSQTTLGARLDLSFQQIQKYEKGANRVSAGRLWAFAAALDVPVSFFFDDMPDVPRAAPGGPAAAADGCPADAVDVLAKRETLELVRAYYDVADAEVRRRLFDLVKSMASTRRRVRHAA
ncbi:helix-turn-helix domain-containing protein [Azospirillum soli]|uniref:helix-turn-helix domain-containing protein n=1 Tax=Azospirillum soli TaxID=1304799 RepID=UPI001AE363A8|nr:helix-turn-helix transcriptional regulator [Azospirillum soli]MBP2312956.1 transcriptional regulator with XRE-family HTH domain [Azospirillum soli]